MLKRILNPDDNAPLDLVNLVSRGYSVAEARRTLGYVLPGEDTEVVAEEPAPVAEEPAPEAEEPAPEAPVAKKFPFIKKGIKKSPADGL